MNYQKKPKRNYGAYWKETAGFDCQKELRIYKFLCGRRMLHKPEVKYCFTKKADWEKYVYDQYAGRSVEQLQNFLIYLKEAKRDAKNFQKVIFYYLLPIIVALISGLLTSYIIGGIGEMEQLKDPFSVIAIALLLFMFVFFLITCGQMKVVLDNSSEKYFYKAYMKIITEIIQKKMEVN